MPTPFPIGTSQRRPLRLRLPRALLRLTPIRP
jgi:hypothetical protein